MKDVSFLGMLVYYWLMKIEAGTFSVNFCEERDLLNQPLLAGRHGGQMLWPGMKSVPL